jgi:chromosome segregation ATPase
MSDQPAQAPVQPDSSGQQVNANSGSQTENWKARYDGLVRKVEELTITNRDLSTQLSTKSSEIEQLKSQLGIKDAEKSVAVGERDKRLNEILSQNTALEGELAQLRALKLQVEIANELGRPELLKLSSRLPALTDKEALKTVMLDFASFADDLVKQREKQILAGVTPSVGPGVQGGPGAPASEQAWMEHINSLPLGSPQRKKALDDYGNWLERKHQPQ